MWLWSPSIHWGHHSCHLARLLSTLPSCCTGPLRGICPATSTTLHRGRLPDRQSTFTDCIWLHQSASVHHSVQSRPRVILCSSRDQREDNRGCTHTFSVHENEQSLTECGNSFAGKSTSYRWSLHLNLPFSRECFPASHPLEYQRLQENPLPVGMIISMKPDHHWWSPPLSKHQLLIGIFLSSLMIYSG